MVSIKNFDEEIKKAKEETIEINKSWWVCEYLRTHKGELIAPKPPLEEVTPKSWFITQWDTGFIVADLEKLMKLPKARRNKIFALGGI